MYRKCLFLTSSLTKTFQAIDPKVAQLITSAEQPDVPKLSKNGSGNASPQMGVIVGYREFFFDFFDVRTAHPVQHTPRILRQSTRFGSRMCLLWIHQYSTSR